MIMVVKRNSTWRKDINPAGIVLVTIDVLAWGVYAAVRALINRNEQLSESVSDPPGALFVDCCCDGTADFKLPGLQEENDSA